MQPRWPDGSAERRADLAACQRLLRGGSRSFHAASLLLPPRVRAPATAIYAFCRLADDAIDDGPGRLAALALLHERLALAYAGRPAPTPADRAFAAVVADHAIPRAVPEALLEGFEWDARGHTYDDLPDLHGYAVRVAGTVGAMMAMLMGVRDGAALARACDLGVAMQLTNIARDVGEDARSGRLYLPKTWLREAELDPEAWLAQPRFSPALGQVVARLLAEADRLYRRATVGIAALPAPCRPGIAAARLLYAEIGRNLAQRGYDSVSRRAVVPRARQLALLMKAMLALRAAPAIQATPPLEAARFLLDAIAVAPPPRPMPRADRAGLVWVLELFQRLEAMQQADGRPA